MICTSFWSRTNVTSYSLFTPITITRNKSMIKDFQHYASGEYEIETFGIPLKRCFDFDTKMIILDEVCPVPQVIKSILASRVLLNASTPLSSLWEHGGMAKGNKLKFIYVEWALTLNNYCSLFPISIMIGGVKLKMHIGNIWMVSLNIMIFFMPAAICDVWRCWACKQSGSYGICECADWCKDKTLLLLLPMRCKVLKRVFSQDYSQMEAQGIWLLLQQVQHVVLVLEKWTKWLGIRNPTHKWGGDIDVSCYV